MYADDMVQFAESPESLQHLLNTLHTYNNEWKLTLNVDKTKIMVFRNGGKVKDNERFFYNGCSVFDTYVNSILNYGCEIWGFHKAKDVEKNPYIIL
jgi:hypothetical protein